MSSVVEEDSWSAGSNSGQGEGCGQKPARNSVMHSNAEEKEQSHSSSDRKDACAIVLQGAHFRKKKR